MVGHVIAGKLKDAAGIAGRHAAREYSGKILRGGIEDDKSNFTRFFLIRKSSGGSSEGRSLGRKAESRESVSSSVSVRFGRLIPRGANKTSIAFKVKNVPGALFKSLSVFALRDIKTQQNRIAPSCADVPGNMSSLSRFPARRRRTRQKQRSPPSGRVVADFVYESAGHLSERLKAQLESPTPDWGRPALWAHVPSIFLGKDPLSALASAPRIPCRSMATGLQFKPDRNLPGRRDETFPREYHLKLEQSYKETYEPAITKPESALSSRKIRKCKINEHCPYCPCGIRFCFPWFARSPWGEKARSS